MAPAASKPLTRRHRYVAAGLFLGFCLTRWMAFPANVTETDEVLFCQAVDGFDLSRHHPHPPGYPLYVALGKAAATMIQPNFAALAWTGLLFSCSAIWPFCRLVMELTGCDRRLAWVAGAVFAFSPVVWLSSAQAFSDVPATAMAIWTAWLLCSASRAAACSRRWRVVAATVLAAAGIGIRPQLAVMLVPLLVLGAAPSAIGWRWRIVSAGAGVAASAAWLVPLIVLSGGWQTYVGLVTEQGKWYWEIDTAFGTVNTDWGQRFRLWLRPWGGPATSIPLALLAGAGFVCLLARRRTAALFAAAWFTPYFLLVLVGHGPDTPRYTLPALAPLALCVGAALNAWPRVGRWMGLALGAGLTVQSASVVWLFHRQEIPPLQAAAWLRSHADHRTDLIAVDDRLEALIPEALQGMNWLPIKNLRGEDARPGRRAWLLSESRMAGATPVFERAWKSKRLRLFTRGRYLSAFVYEADGQAWRAAIPVP